MDVAATHKLVKKTMKNTKMTNALSASLSDFQGIKIINYSLMNITFT